MFAEEDVFSGMFGGLLYGLGIADLAMPIGFLFWALIFLVGLKKIDCNDPVTASLYALYCAASGVVLVLAIPFKYSKIDNITANLVLIILFVVIALYRWNTVRKKLKKSIQSLRAEEMKGETLGKGK